MTYKGKISAASLVLLLAGIGSSLACETGQRTWTLAAPNVVTLEDDLVQKRFYGPPRYGDAPETDQTFTDWLLRLRYDINVHAEGADCYERRIGIKQVSLGVKASEDKERILSLFETFRGQEVEVTGTLHEEPVEGRWSQTFMDVHEIALAPPSPLHNDDDNGVWVGRARATDMDPDELNDGPMESAPRSDPN